MDGLATAGVLVAILLAALTIFLHRLLCCDPASRFVAFSALLLGGGGAFEVCNPSNN
jgi:hypothetical protein